MRRRRLPVIAAPLLVAFVTLVGLYDQTGTDLRPEHYRATEAAWKSMETYVAQVEDALPPRTAVYQLPEQHFPESAGPGAMHDYDSAMPYLHSRDLRWSYGVIKGRQGRWLIHMATIPLEQKLPIVSACGFGAVWVDRAGYERPEDASAVGRLVGGEPITSPDGRYEVYALDGYSRGQMARTRGERDRMCASALAYGADEIG